MISNTCVNVYNSNTNEFISENDIKKIKDAHEIHHYEVQIKNIKHNIESFFGTFPIFLECKKRDEFLKELDNIKLQLDEQKKKIKFINLKKLEQLEEEKNKYINGYEPYILYCKNTEKLKTKKRKIDEQTQQLTDCNCNCNCNCKKMNELKNIEHEIQEEINIFQCSCIHKYTSKNYSSGYEIYKDCLVCNKEIFIRDRHP